MANGPNEVDAGSARSFGAVIEKGSQLIGSLIGGGVGLVGGPVGAFGGAAAGWASGEALYRIGSEVLGRMTTREALRVGAVAAVIEADATQRFQHEAERRQDGFFSPQGERRPDGEELLEGLLRYAAETYEERKLPHLGHLHDAISYDEALSPGMAIHLLRWRTS